MILTPPRRGPGSVYVRARETSPWKARGQDYPRTGRRSSHPPHCRCSRAAEGGSHAGPVRMPRASERRWTRKPPFSEAKSSPPKTKHSQANEHFQTNSTTDSQNKVLRKALGAAHIRQNRETGRQAGSQPKRERQTHRQTWESEAKHERREQSEGKKRYV